MHSVSFALDEFDMRHVVVLISLILEYGTRQLTGFGHFSLSLSVPVQQSRSYVNQPKAFPTCTQCARPASGATPNFPSLVLPRSFGAFTSLAIG